MATPTYVRDIMTTPAATISRDAAVRDAARLLQERNIGACPVIDASGKLVGMITEGDFTGMARCIPFTLDLAPVIFGARVATPQELTAIYAKAAQMPIHQVMSSPCISIEENAPIGKAVKLMLDHHIKHLPVVKDHKVIGIISRHDLLKLLGQTP